jgi:hypothetical protein
MPSLTLSGKTMLPAIVLAFAALCAFLWWVTRPASDQPRNSDQPADVFRPPAPTAPVEAPALQPAERRSTPEPAPSALPSGAPPTPAAPERGASLGGSASESAPPPAEGSEPPISKGELKAAVQSVKPLIQQCFLDVAQRYPGNHKVVLKFTIVGQGLTGHFKDGEVVDSTIPDPWLQACFLDSLTDARFPAPSGGGTVTVTYPFSFTSQPEDAGSPQGG